MEPRDKQRSLQQDEVEAPTIEHRYRDALEGSKVLPDSVVVAENDTRDTWETEGTLPEEDDDNATRTATKPCPTRKRSASCHETRPGRESPSPTFPTIGGGLSLCAGRMQNVDAAQNSNAMKLFVFEALKRGFTLHEKGLAPATFLGGFPTVQPFPMVIAGPFCSDDDQPPRHGTPFCSLSKPRGASLRCACLVGLQSRVQKQRQAHMGTVLPTFKAFQFTICTPYPRVGN